MSTFQLWSKKTGGKQNNPKWKFQIHSDPKISASSIPFIEKIVYHLPDFSEIPTATQTEAPFELRFPFQCANFLLRFDVYYKHSPNPQQCQHAITFEKNKMHSSVQHNYFVDSHELHNEIMKFQDKPTITQSEFEMMKSNLKIPEMDRAYRSQYDVVPFVPIPESKYHVDVVQKPIIVQPLKSRVNGENLFTQHFQDGKSHLRFTSQIHLSEYQSLKDEVVRSTPLPNQLNLETLARRLERLDADERKYVYNWVCTDTKNRQDTNRLISIDTNKREFAMNLQKLDRELLFQLLEFTQVLDGADPDAKRDYSYNG